MEYDFSKVIGDRLPDFDAVFAALRCQIDPAKPTASERQRIEGGVLEEDRYSVLKRLMSAGADPGRFGWTDIFLALAFGTKDDLEEALTGNSDLEALDGQRRTAFLFSIQIGDIEKTKLLLDAGANILAIGQLGETALDYAIDQDDVRMLEWLLEQGFDPEMEDPDGKTAIYTASAKGAVGCLRKLIECGADIGSPGSSGSTAIDVACDPQVIRILVEAGAALTSLEPDQLASLLGYQFDEEPECSLEEYRQYSSRAFGRFNPERVHNPFWTAMVRCGGSAALAEMKFSRQSRALRKSKNPISPTKTKKTWNDPRRTSKTEPVSGGGYPIWCYRRFGKSINRLPDGRFIEIAGEHEDFYDLNFCIYNDVIVHDGRGQCEIYAYPPDVFPPTDSHSATLVGDFIYIIGNLGYGPDRRPGFTPVYRLDINSFKIEQVETSGDMPGWIHRHSARYDGRAGIVVSGGQCIVLDDGALGVADNTEVFTLDLDALNWTRNI